MKQFKGWSTGTPCKRGWYWVCNQNESVAMLAEWSGFDWTFPYQEKLWREQVDYWVRLEEPAETPKIQSICAEVAAQYV
jgi:hypothetical protein